MIVLHVVDLNGWYEEILHHTFDNKDEALAHFLTPWMEKWNLNTGRNMIKTRS